MWCNPRANKIKANPAVFWSATREGVMCSFRISHIEVEKKKWSACSRFIHKQNRFPAVLNTKEPRIYLLVSQNKENHNESRIFIHFGNLLVYINKFSV